MNKSLEYIHKRLTEQDLTGKPFAFRVDENTYGAYVCVIKRDIGALKFGEYLVRLHNLPAGERPKNIRVYVYTSDKEANQHTIVENDAPFEINVSDSIMTGFGGGLSGLGGYPPPQYDHFGRPIPPQYQMQQFQQMQGFQPQQSLGDMIGIAVKAATNEERVRNLESELDKLKDEHERLKQRCLYWRRKSKEQEEDSKIDWMELANGPIGQMVAPIILSKVMPTAQEPPPPAQAPQAQSFSGTQNYQEPQPTNQTPQEPKEKIVSAIKAKRKNAPEIVVVKFEPEELEDNDNFDELSEEDYDNATLDILS